MFSHASACQKCIFVAAVQVYVSLECKSILCRVLLRSHGARFVSRGLCTFPGPAPQVRKSPDIQWSRTDTAPLYAARPDFAVRCLRPRSYMFTERGRVVPLHLFLLCGFGSISPQRWHPISKSNRKYGNPHNKDPEVPQHVSRLVLKSGCRAI